MDDFREWLSDNLRYILLGLAIILVIVLAFFAVKLVSGLGKTEKPVQTESQQKAVDLETEDQSGSESETSEALVQNDPAILETVQKYYTAVGNKDIETLKQIVETLDEKDQQAIENNDVIESYNNISVYSKNGPVEGSYVVYAYYEAKLAGFETAVPSLMGLYLCTREDGSLYVADWDSDESVTAFIEKQKSEPDVKALIDRVDQACKDAEDSDPELKAYMDSLEVPETENVIPQGNEAGVEVNKLVQAKEACNIRSDSREDADIVGSLSEGETITRLRKLDNGWSEVRLSDGSGYVRSDLLTEEVTQQ
ncbi:MAG: SH3 domain-containing protein [Blautia sp.]|nr:SH3 domain-containing protein [Blautia sp.]